MWGVDSTGNYANRPQRTDPVRNGSTRGPLRTKVSTEARAETSVRPSDNLIVAAMITAPMTDLRLAGVLGPAEIFAALWLIWQMLAGAKCRLPLRLSLSWLAVLAGFAVAGFGSSASLGDMSRVLLTWVFLGTVFLGLVGYIGHASRARKLLIRGTISSSLVHFLVLVYSLTVSTSLGSFDLWFLGVRFAGLADNPHQLSLATGAALLLSVKFGLEQRGRNRLGWILLAAMIASVGLATNSASLYAALFVGIAIAAVAWVVKQLEARGVVILTFAAVVGVVALDLIERATRAFIEADANGWDRLHLWTSFQSVMGNNLFLGLGPNYFVSGASEEFHNMYLDTWTQGGLLALIALMIILGSTVQRSFSFPMYLSVLAYLAAYGLAGYSARRLIFWLLLGLIWCAIERQPRSESDSGSAPAPRPDREATAL